MPDKSQDPIPPQGDESEPLMNLERPDETIGERGAEGFSKRKMDPDPEAEAETDPSKD